MSNNFICNSIREIKNLIIKNNKKSYYINLGEWEILIEEEVMEDAIAISIQAKSEVANEANITVN